MNELEAKIRELEGQVQHLRKHNLIYEKAQEVI